MCVSLENNQWRIFHILTSEDIDDDIFRFALNLQQQLLAQQQQQLNLDIQM